MAFQAWLAAATVVIAAAASSSRLGKIQGKQKRTSTRNWQRLVVHTPSSKMDYRSPFNRSVTIYMQKRINGKYQP
jgi:hypothetical protein